MAAIRPETVPAAAAASTSASQARRARIDRMEAVAEPRQVSPIVALIRLDLGFDRAIAKAAVNRRAIAETGLDCLK